MVRRRGISIGVTSSVPKLLRNSCPETPASVPKLPHRGHDGPKYFLKDYRQVLLADAYGGYNGVVAGNEITRAGCWAHLRRKVIEAEKSAPEIAREAIEMMRPLYVAETMSANGR